MTQIILTEPQRCVLGSLRLTRAQTPLQLSMVNHGYTMVQIRLTIAALVGKGLAERGPDLVQCYKRTPEGEQWYQTARKVDDEWVAELG